MYIFRFMNSKKICITCESTLIHIYGVIQKNHSHFFENFDPTSPNNRQNSSPLTPFFKTNFAISQSKCSNLGNQFWQNQFTDDTAQNLKVPTQMFTILDFMECKITFGIWWQDGHQCAWNEITIPFLSNLTKVALSSGTS